MARHIRDLIAEALGISELVAEFIIAMEQGEISGDVEVIEEKAPADSPPAARIANPRHQN